MIYFDNAATSFPKPPQVAEAIADFLANLAVNPGRGGFDLSLEGGLLVDNPGMRELALTEAEEGVQSLFADIDALAEGCRFRNCRHRSEPGCAVLAALAAGEISARRMESYRRLLPA